MFRNLDHFDYYKNYLNLLEQLTDVNITKINNSKFSNFVNGLDANHHIVVLEENNKILATATLLIEKKIIHGLRCVGHIEDVVVDTTARNKGLGKKIIEHMVDLAQKNGCYKVILNCKEFNCKFYEKCGFKKNEIEMSKYFI